MTPKEIKDCKFYISSDGKEFQELHIGDISLECEEESIDIKTMFPTEGTLIVEDSISWYWFMKGLNNTWRREGHKPIRYKQLLRGMRKGWF